MTSSLSSGWHVSDHALGELLEEIPSDANKLETQIMDLDLKSFGLPSLQDKMDKSSGIVKGPIVLQISRIRDCGRASLGESNPSNLLRVFLTDGHQAVSGIAIEKIIGLSEEKTPWGTKILLKGEVKVEGQFILLTPSNVTVMGGRVDRLIERWSIEKNSMKGMARKNGEVAAPKWVSFGKRDNNGEAVKNTKGFRANDVLKGATGKEEEEEGEDEFEKARKEKLEAVEGTERKFAKVDAPKGGLSEEAKVEAMKEKMRKRGEKEEERRELRGMRGGGRGRGRGRRGSDDEPDVPSEFARPSQGITLSSFLGDGVAPAAVAAPSFNASPPPMIYKSSDRGMRGGRGRGEEGRGGYGRDDGRGGYGKQEGRGGYGREDGRGGYGKQEERGGYGREDGGGGYGRAEGRGGYGKQEGRGGYGREDGGGGYGRSEGRGGYGKEGSRGEYGRHGERGGNGQQEGRGGYGRQEGREGYGSEKIPSLMSEADFPSVDGLSKGMGGMKIGGMRSDDMRGGKGGGGGGVREGSRVKAPADDGNFYPATVVYMASGSEAIVKFDGHDAPKTLPIGVLLQ
ncbi:hypothetical protein PFISCL1PPCAC_1980 [Pristionchus fissidentatus]|uniref:RecQ mediated genome instability protein 1 OB-fold domain-containing protein n=1 Tax=Pristionchus fissidentatus TaxID=1538716 RepID=A0AAV5UVD0_9BILA|nr:hypothetical protein PFISCL1PPCAC_1980 [Pristionchus fissidentatus]